MSLIANLLLAVGLGMDAMAVSVSNGNAPYRLVCRQQYRPSNIRL